MNEKITLSNGMGGALVAVKSYGAKFKNRLLVGRYLIKPLLFQNVLLDLASRHSYG